MICNVVPTYVSTVPIHSTFAGRVVAAAVWWMYLASSLPTRQLCGCVNISTASGVVWFAICRMVWLGGGAIPRAGARGGGAMGRWADVMSSYHSCVTIMAGTGELREFGEFGGMYVAEWWWRRGGGGVGEAMEWSQRTKIRRAPRLRTLGQRWWNGVSFLGSGLCAKNREATLACGDLRVYPMTHYPPPGPRLY